MEIHSERVCEVFYYQDPHVHPAALDLFDKNQTRTLFIAEDDA